MEVKTYSPGDVNVTAGPIKITGFAEGSFVKVEPNTPEQYTAHVGAKGEVSRSKSADKSGRVTLTLKATSPANTKLQALAKAPGLFPTAIIAPHRTVTAPDCWIEKIPSDDFADEEGTVEWVIFSADITKIFL